MIFEVEYFSWTRLGARVCSLTNGDGVDYILYMCMENYQHIYCIYIFIYMNMVHMSAVRLYALSEIINGDNEFKIFMRNLDLLYLP